MGVGAGLYMFDVVVKSSRSLAHLLMSLVMVALCNRADHYIFMLYLFFSSPNLSGRRLDVYHTSAHGVALVRI